MHQASRPPPGRVDELDRAIRAGESPNAGPAARRLEVCRHTIRLDLDSMRDRLDAPLSFDARRRGHVDEDATYRMPFWPLTGGELVALFLAGRALRQWRGTPSPTARPWSGRPGGSWRCGARR